MKFFALSLLGLAGIAVAWNGQLIQDDENTGEGGIRSRNVHLVDYDTKSRYSATLLPDWTSNVQSVFFVEDNGGGYNWPAQLWQTLDGCYNIGFEGAFGGAGHGYCCDGLPCDINA
ncbi:hypothetical protein GGI43DRAFT_385219 [Trichoderma evansii]